MDPEVLQRLITDRALGALSPDAGRLLDAYLQADPAAAAVARQIDETVQLARGALAEVVPSSMPAFPVAGFAQIERWRRRARQLRVAGAMAACLAVGLGLGRWTVPVKIEQPVNFVRKDVPAKVAVSVVPHESGGFWSIQRIREQYERAERRPSHRSPVQLPFPWSGPARSS